MGKSKKKTGLYYLTNFLLVALFFVLAVVLINAKVLNAYYTGIMTLICVNVILAVSLNLVTGILGQLVLGHAGFMLVGAYTAALFTMNCKSLPLSVSFPLGLLLAGLFAAVCGILIGIPALRLRGDYLAIITLGFGEIIRIIANNLKITNGAMGLTGIPSISNRKSPATLFIYAFAIAVLAVAIMFTFGRSRHGRAVISIREDEIASESMGINTTYYKLFAFVLAAFIAGIAGGIYSHSLNVIDPSKYDFNKSVEILIMVVLGGMGSITGSILAATALTILNEALRDFSMYRMLVYAIILILVMLFKPSGLLGRYEFSVPGLIDKVIHGGESGKAEKKSKEA